MFLPPQIAGWWAFAVNHWSDLSRYRRALPNLQGNEVWCLGSGFFAPCVFELHPYHCVYVWPARLPCRGVFNEQIPRSFQCILLLMVTCSFPVFGYCDKCCYKILTCKCVCEHIIWSLFWIAWTCRKWMFNFIRSLQTFFPKWCGLRLIIAPRPPSVSSQHALGYPPGCSLSLETGLHSGAFCLSETIQHVLFHLAFSLRAVLWQSSVFLPVLLLCYLFVLRTIALCVCTTTWLLMNLLVDIGAISSLQLSQMPLL